MSGIAAANATSVSDLVSANKITNQNLILIGQQLQLAKEQAQSAATTYTVKSGDTLSEIAESHNVSQASLISYNNLQNPNVLKIGQILKLTGATTATTQSSAATKSTSTATTTQSPKTTTTTKQTTTPAKTTASANSATTSQSSKATTSQSSSAKSVTPATKTTTSVAKATTSAKTSSNSSTTATSNKGTFKLSFYDPAKMGSSMGYGGVAANLSVFPRGTRLKITLSNGTVWYRTVNDTGTFAQSNSRQLDVAMPTSQIPSAGILYANVQVLQ